MAYGGGMLPGSRHYKIARRALAAHNQHAVDKIFEPGRAEIKAFEQLVADIQRIIALFAAQRIIVFLTYETAVYGLAVAYAYFEVGVVAVDDLPGVVARPRLGLLDFLAEIVDKSLVLVGGQVTRYGDV